MRWRMVIAALAIGGVLSACRRAEPAGPLVLIVVDALRADHLPCYGYDRPTAPQMCAIGADGVRFTRAYTVRTHTTPAVASMLTGLYPHRHGVIDLLVEVPAEVPTTAEMLRAAGWRTGAFVSSFVMIGQLTGFGRGFEVYEDRVQTREAFRENYQRDARETMDLALAWLRQAGRHSFLFVHLIEPHGPYTPPEPHRGRFALPPDARRPAEIQGYQRIPGLHTAAEYIGRYDGEIATADAEVGRLLAALREWGWYDGATVLLTADHGESLGEEGLWFEHGRSVGEAEARVPLLVKFAGPAAPRGVVATPVSLVDLHPTLLAAAGLSSARPGLAGADLRAVAGGAPRQAPAPVTEVDIAEQLTLAVHLPDCSARWTLPRSAIAAAAAPGGRAEPAPGPPVDPACAAAAWPALQELLADRAAFVPVWTPRAHLAMRDRANRTRFVESRAGRAAQLDEAGREAMRQLGYLE